MKKEPIPYTNDVLLTPDLSVMEQLRKLREATLYRDPREANPIRKGTNRPKFYRSRRDYFNFHIAGFRRVEDADHCIVTLAWKDGNGVRYDLEFVLYNDDIRALTHIGKFGLNYVTKAEE